MLGLDDAIAKRKETEVLNPYLQHLCLTVISLKDKTIAKDLNKRSQLNKKLFCGMGPTLKLWELVHE